VSAHNFAALRFEIFLAAVASITEWYFPCRLIALTDRKYDRFMWQAMFIA
jgi:hypothetical protein